MASTVSVRLARGVPAGQNTLESLKLSNDNDSTEAGGEASPRPIYSSPLSSAEWRVLFVGGDAIWFDQVKRDLVCLQPHWRSLHATDTATAIRTLEVHPIDAVVLDSRVPGVRGLIETLNTAGDEILRVLRCDMSDRFTVDSLKGLGVPMVTAHGDATRIAASLIRNASLRDWTRNPPSNASCRRFASCLPRTTFIRASRKS